MLDKTFHIKTVFAADDTFMCPACRRIVLGKKTASFKPCYHLYYAYWDKGYYPIRYVHPYYADILVKKALNSAKQIKNIDPEDLTLLHIAGNRFKNGDIFGAFSITNLFDLILPNPREHMKEGSIIIKADEGRYKKLQLGFWVPELILERRYKYHMSEKV